MEQQVTTAETPELERVWAAVSETPLQSLWSFQGTSPKLVWTRVFKSFLDDNLFSRAAELGYYFLFALFPTLVSASALLGLAAKHASQIYVGLLHYLSLIVPPSAFQIVLDTFNQTTTAATKGKVTLGLAAALWSASVGFSAIQDGMNIVYKTKETRPYWKARGSAILVTVLLAVLVTLSMATLFAGDFAADHALQWFPAGGVGFAAKIGIHAAAYLLVTALLILQFSVVYYFAPDLKSKRWHWLTPGAAIGLVGWVAASLGLKVYLHYFNSYSVTYGSLGAVIVLLTWFYISGLMLMLGAEINSEIQAAVVEKKLKDAGVGAVSP